MKPKLILTVASVLFLVLGLSGFSLVSSFNFYAYIGIIFTLCLSILFWLARNAPLSKTMDAILITAFLMFFLGGMLALYGQWSGNYMDSPTGYLDGVVWLAIAIWFFLVGRANRSTSAG